jgi:tRNA(Ile)-lysidine synthase
VEEAFASGAGRPDEVTVALSGGIDSVVLLDVLRAASRARGFRVRALHVNHGLSPHAERWEKFCQAHCRSRRIPFQAARVVVRGGGANVEAEARNARYAAFARDGGRIVALAHNRDDQAETLLLQLLRGAGLRGLSAMPAVRVVGPAGERAPLQRLLRPLLAVSREEIEVYAARRRLAWVEDESNRQDRFARNFLRARIVPELEQRFPGCSAALARSSAHIATAAALLDDLALIDAASALRAQRLQVAALVALGRARAANLLRYFLRMHGLSMPSADHLDEMLDQLCNARSDANPLVILEGMSLRRFRGSIELVPLQPVDRKARAIRWNGEARLALPQGGELCMQRTRGHGVSAACLAAGIVTVRRREGGERMQLESERPRRTLKNLLQEARVTPWQRERMPLLYLDEQLVWAPLIGAACAFRAKGREHALLFSWRELGPAPGQG